MLYLAQFTAKTVYYMYGDDDVLQGYRLVEAENPQEAELKLRKHIEVREDYCKTTRITYCSIEEVIK